MAWTAPSTFVAGAILTAAQLNTNVRDNTLAGGPIYTTEALRDAAITSPFEGQRAYITASTVAAAAGAVTAVPTGIQTIYNGTSWVCVTPVGASTATVGTRASGTYGTLTGGGTNPAVTLTTGTTALVSLTAGAALSISAAGLFVSVAVSGATTLAASNANGVQFDVSTANYNLPLATTYVLTGLTAGTNTFTLNYANSGAATGTYFNRAITVSGIA